MEQARLWFTDTDKTLVTPKILQVALKQIQTLNYDDQIVKLLYHIQ